MRLRFFFRVIIILLTVSCNNKDIKEKDNIIGHTFFRITKTDSMDIIKQPCDARIATYKFYKDSIVHDWGQEIEAFKVLRSEDRMSFIRNFQHKNEVYQLKILDKEKHYWLINNEVFIDSLYIETIPYVEQNCIECYSEDVCSETDENKTVIVGPVLDNSIDQNLRDTIKLAIIHLNDSIIQIDINNNKNIQSIMYKPYSIGEHNIVNYNNKINLHNDYDVVMADYNFDNRMDFAILYDKTINTGTVFTYFLQSKNGKFYKDKNFPLTLIPTAINKENKTLSQSNIVGCCTLSTAVYQLNKKDEWSVIFSEIKDMNE